MRSGHGETIEIDDVAPGRSGDIIIFGARAISSHRHIILSTILRYFDLYNYDTMMISAEFRKAVQ